MARLSAEDKLLIINDYAVTQSLTATSEHTGHDIQTVKRTVTDPNNKLMLETAQKTAVQDSMRKYLDSRLTKIQGLVDSYIDAMTDPDKIAKANVQQLAMTAGIMLDKFSPRQTECGPVAIQINFNAGGQGDDFA